jgi:hypothetical protein
MQAPSIARVQLDADPGHVKATLDQHLWMIKDTQRIGGDFASCPVLPPIADMRNEHAPSAAWRSLASEPGSGLLGKLSRKIGLERSHRIRARSLLLRDQRAW